MTRREGPDAIPLVGGVEAGNEPQPAVSVTVLDRTNGGNAALYSDEFLTIPAANPITTDANGRFLVYVKPGQYGFTVPAGADPLEDVIIGSLASGSAAVPPTFLRAVRAAATANVAALTAPQTVDGVALVAGDRVLLTAQSTGAQNGIYVVQTGAWTRAADMPIGISLPIGVVVPVGGGGTVNGNALWQLNNTTPVVVATGTPLFQRIAGTSVGYSVGSGGAVTQITSSATGVTINKPTGQITTVALTTAAGAEERFTVTDSFVAAADSVVFGTTYNGAGTPQIGSAINMTAGTFDIVITNLHASNALNALMVINFAIIKGSAS